MNQGNKDLIVAWLQTYGWWLVILLLLVAFILFANDAYGATQKYSIEERPFDTQLEYGEQHLGYFIVNNDGFRSKTIKWNNLQNATFDKTDKLDWQGSDNIRIYKDNEHKITLSADDSPYSFSETGTYKINLTNSNKTSEVEVVSRSNKLINLSVETENDNLNVKHPDSIDISDGNKNINMSINANESLEPGDYNINFIFDDGITKELINKTVTMPRFRTFKILNNTLKDDYKLQAGKVQELGTMTVQNTGNTDFNIDSFEYGNISQFITTQDTLNLYKDNKVSFQLYAQLPLKQTSGYFEGRIQLVGGNTSYDHNLSINITDKTNPKILNISYDDMVVYKDAKIYVRAEDNVFLERCELEIDNETFKSKFDGQECMIELSKEVPKDYEANISVYDSSNNVNSTQENLTFTKINAVSDIEELVMPTKKHGNYAEGVVLNLSEDIPKPINITMTDYHSDKDNVKSDMEFKYADSEYQKIEDINDTYQFDTNGSVILRLRNANSTKYYGELKIDYPNMLNVSNSKKIIKFEGEHVDYGVPEPFTRVLPGDGEHKISCDVINTGNLDSTKLDCNFLYDISGSTTSDMFVVFNTERLENIHKNYNNTINNLNDENHSLGLILTITILTSISIVFLVFVLMRRGIFVTMVRDR
ncbi:MAG: hypothetical protein ACOC2U_01775 [bacterium]